MAGATKDLQRKVCDLGDALERANDMRQQEQKTSEELRQQLCKQAHHNKAYKQNSQAQDELLEALLSNRFSIAQSDQSLQDNMEKQSIKMVDLRCKLEKAEAMLVHEQAAMRDLRVQLE